MRRSKLQILSNPSSPLLALLYTASHNTAVANQDIAKAISADAGAGSSRPPRQAYVRQEHGFVNGLVGLQGAVSQVAQDPTPQPSWEHSNRVITAAISAHGAVSQTAQAFNIDPQAHIEQTVLALLQAPINSAEDIAKPGPRRAAALCASFAPLLSKFPFSPNAQPSKQVRLRSPLSSSRDRARYGSSTTPH